MRGELEARPDIKITSSWLTTPNGQVYLRLVLRNDTGDEVTLPWLDVTRSVFALLRKMLREPDCLNN